MAPQNPPSSHQESRSTHTRPYVYRPLSDGYEGISHKRDRDSVDGNQHHQLAMTSHDHEYSRFDAKSSRRTHSVSSESRRDCKRVSRDTYRDQDAVASSSTHGHAHHMNNHTMPMTSKNKEVSDESRHQASHKDKHQIPVPPKAPKITRLPTPDFDDIGHSEYDMSNHQFCECCGDDGSSCTTAKIEKRVNP
ncbi:hypothetical protein F5Y00DRAFT_267078 [Daldinia vernicosa]|uniref:uncharacterized protein n=1 Tax=Daldinia vernicosa TaxID=114800 RepID=UPI0020088D56|nr:uncharacterized protein F5Y00DRAFT_267078 [Daldinia vernicosa]KAI0843930.1 hypothetical protein F5Y00DRAFT_267078 [Daldinia vernicosa]